MPTYFYLWDWVWLIMWIEKKQEYKKNFRFKQDLNSF